MFDKFYKKLETNITNMNHIFSYTNDDLGSLSTHQIIISVSERYFLVKSKRKLSWIAVHHAIKIEGVKMDERVGLPKVGLRDIKAVELQKKFYPIIPGEHKAEFLKMAPPPPLAIMGSVREANNKKARDKTAAKKSKRFETLSLPYLSTIMYLS